MRRQWLRECAILLFWTCLLLPTLLFGIYPLLRLFSAVPLAGRDAEAFLAPATRDIVVRTLALGLLVASLATAAGVYFGYRLGAKRWPGKGPSVVLLVLPLTVPPYILALGWTMLCKADGPLSRLFATLGVHGPVATNFIYSLAGAVAVLSLAFFPVALAFVVKACGTVSPALLETAQVFGANRRQTFLAAYWPFIRPSAMASAAVIFLLTIAELGVPTLLKVSVFNFEVFTQLSAFNNVDAALVLTLPLLLCGLMAASLLGRLLADRVQRDIQDFEYPPRASRTETIANALLAAALAVVTLLLPVGAIAANGLSVSALSRMMRLAFHPALNTLWYAGLAAASTVIVASLLAWILLGDHQPLMRLTRAILMLAFAIPGTIIALALIPVYENGGFSRWLPAQALVVAALYVRYQILAFEIINAALSELPKDLFDAAALDGAGTLTLMGRIVLPWLRTPVLFAWALSFLAATTEIGSTLLLYPPGGETLPIALFAIEANSPRSFVAALSLLQLLACSIPVALLAGAMWLYDRKTRS